MLSKLMINSRDSFKKHRPLSSKNMFECVKMHCAFIDHIARTTTGFAHSEMSEGGGGGENSNGNLDVLFKIARGNTGRTAAFECKKYFAAGIFFKNLLTD